jgi:hypothetical protein
VSALGNNSVRMLIFLNAEDVHLLKYVAAGSPGYCVTRLRVLEKGRRWFNVEQRQNSYVSGC